MSETVEIVLPVDNQYSLLDPDYDVAREARDHYEVLAWQQLQTMPQYTVREAYSSWLPQGPRLAKVVMPSMRAMAERLYREQDTDAVHDDGEGYGVGPSGP